MIMSVDVDQFLLVKYMLLFQVRMLSHIYFSITGTYDWREPRIKYLPREMFNMVQIKVIDNYYFITNSITGPPNYSNYKKCKWVNLVRVKNNIPFLE